MTKLLRRNEILMILKSALAISISALSLFAATPVAQNGHLSVSGTNLINEGGNPIQLRGMSTHGLQYFDGFYTENSIKALAEGWGADIIRISSYVNEGHEGDNGVKDTYLTNPTYWKNKVDEIVDYATEAGMYAMIDWHMLGPGDPNVYIDEAKEFWTYMAQTHGGKENVIFDICNEPNDHGEWVSHNGTLVENPLGYKVTWPLIKQYADEIIPIIRANDPDDKPNVVIVGTPDWASSPNKVIGNEISDPNVMYTMHFYAAADGHGIGYQTKMMEAVNAGLPIFVTEFGTQASSGDLANDFYESQIWIDLLAEHKISWCNWNYSDDFRTGAVFTEEASLHSVASYADSANLKAAGQWIMDKMKYPADDFGVGALPTVEIRGGVQGNTTEASPTFAWRGNDIDGQIVAYHVNWDNSSTVIELAPSVSSATPDSPLSTGSHSFTIRSEDNDGNFSTAETWIFFVTDGNGFGVNLLDNGDFESGETGWGLSINESGATASAGFYSGEAIISGINPSWERNGWGIQLVQSNISLEQGKSYSLTFKAKADSPRAINSSIIKNESPYTDYSNGSWEFDLTTQLQEFTYEFSMEHSSDAAALLTFDLGSESPTITIDDVVLTESSGSTVDISTTPLVNMSFVDCFTGSSSIKIPLQANATVTKIVISDVKGRIVHNEVIQNNHIDISNILTSQGVFFIQLQTSAGVVAAKIIR